MKIRLSIIFIFSSFWTQSYRLLYSAEQAPDREPCQGGMAGANYRIKEGNLPEDTKKYIKRAGL